VKKTMATMHTVTSPAHAPDMLCPCPACGGLECLCRPRFFAGQLLTEEDLNRLDQYIVAKQKLHNRYLHGWGVVCGLNVVCDGCDSGSVMVRPGYALSPCGEDVIVCADTRVPICDLISQCREVPKPDCNAPTPVTGCDEAVQQWVLAICYAETPSRGVVPLRSSPGCECECGGGCGCGGTESGAKGGCERGGASKHGGSKSAKSGGCGCGGGSSSSRGTVATMSAARGAALMQCENTVVCESYRFRAYKAPRATDRKETAGAMADAFLACVKEFTDAMPSFEPPTTGNQAVHDWCCEMHDAFTDWFLSHPPYDCDLARRIAGIACPNPNDPNFNAAIAQARSQFLLGALEILLSCFCLALMPPCPAPPGDDCVPLAVVTVRTADGCHVQSICNWTIQRKYVTTFPSLQYWLSFLPFGRMLREAIEGLCCRSFLRRDPAPRSPSADQPRETGIHAAAPETAPANGAATTGGTASAKDISPSTHFRGTPQTMARSRAFMQLALQSLASRATSANAEQLVLGIVGDKDAEGKPPLTELEADNLMQFLILDQMAKPTMRNVLGDQAVGGVTMETLFGGAPSGDLASQIDELRATVERQQRRIDELARNRPPRNRNR